MTLAEEIEKVNRINETDVKDLSLILLHYLSLRNESSNDLLKYQDSVLGELLAMLGKYINENELATAEKLILVKLIDKLNLQKELVELKSKGGSMDDLKIAAQRLGKKSQSAFSGD